MNLATDPWIPVVRIDGQIDTVSLEEAFDQGLTIRDLEVRPHERIALMRLLLAIAHAGLDGPSDESDWRRCREGLAYAALGHLGKHRASFELLGKGARFGQLYSGTNHAPKPHPTQPMWASKLDLLLATGHKSTLIDNAASTLRAFTPPALARMLLAYQACSPLVGGHRKGRSPCIEDNMLHTFLSGENLLETLWLNLLDRALVERHYGAHNWEIPVWLAMPESPTDEPAIRNATQTFLGRLVPLPRAIWLAEDGRTIALEAGLKYPAWVGEPAEPSATLMAGKSNKERRVFGIQLSRALWRDWPALAIKRRSNGARGALAWQRFSDNQLCDFRVVGVVTDRMAKVVDMVDSLFVPPANAGGDRFLKLYEGGVRYAEDWAFAVKKGLALYREALGDKPGHRSRKRMDLIYQNATAYFWTAIEAAVPGVLIPLSAEPPEALRCEAPYFLDYDRQEEGWGPIVRQAADEAFALACPLESARQAIAFGAGRIYMLKRRPRTRGRVISTTPVASSGRGEQS
ncbi:MAG: type I-E CRISPR-associated protein Cse1/CasA [Verrucomicrobia bacterium]|nr:type I-E CRISPR-associated protein Cse1/CasA [Verrucomicrobiota bacterium]